MRTGATPPVSPMAREPLSVRVRRVVPVLLKVGRPEKVMSLPTMRSALSTKREVPDAKVTEPAPSGPEAVPAPPCCRVLLDPSTMPPAETVSAPVKAFWPLSCRRPSPVLVTETPVPMMFELMLSVGVSSA